MSLSLPPPGPFADPVPLRVPDADVERRNAAQRTRAWWAVGVATAIIIGAAVIVPRLSDGTTAIPPLPNETPSTEPLSVVGPTTSATKPNTGAPLANAAGQVTDVEPGTAQDPTTSQPSIEPAASQPSISGPLGTRPVAPPARPQPTQVPPVTTEPAPNPRPPTQPDLTAPANRPPIGSLVPLGDGVLIVVASDDGVVIESSLGVVSLLEEQADVAFLVGTDDVIFQRRQGRPPLSSQSSDRWNVGATNIERRSSKGSAVLVVAEDFGFLTLRSVSVRNGAIRVLYEASRGSQPANSDGQLRELDLLRGVTNRRGLTGPQTPPFPPVPEVLEALGVPPALASQVSDVAESGGVFVLNRMKDPGAPRPALIADARTGSPVLSELTTPGRATLPA